MNEVEMREVLSVFGINKSQRTEWVNGTETSVYSFGTASVCYGGNQFAIVRNLPLKVAEMVEEKYPNNPYEIKTDSLAIDDEYKQEISITGRTNRAEEKLQQRTSDNKYIEYCRVETVEGLIVLLLEMRDYWIQKYNLEVQDTKSKEDILSEVLSKVLTLAKPTIKNSEWLENNKIFLTTQMSEQDNPEKLKLKALLDTFDKTINPFLNEEIALKDMKEIVGNVELSVGTSSRYIDECYLRIRDKKDTPSGFKNQAEYWRGRGVGWKRKRCFSYDLSYTKDDGTEVTATHYYTEELEDPKDNGEALSIGYSTGHLIYYNLTHDRIEVDGSKRMPAKPRHYEQIGEELQKVIGYASTVTISNMSKKMPEKKLNP